MDDIVPQTDYDRDLPAAPGIYVIVNLANEHIYVGSATSLSQRKYHHFGDLKAGKHKNAHLQRAYDHYGPEAFLFVVLELVDHVEHLLVREQFYIDALDPEYNIARTAGSNLGMTYSPETRANMSAAAQARANMLEQMAKLNADRTGKPLTPEHRAKISAIQAGKELPPETKARMSAASLGKKKTPEHAANIRAAKLGKPRDPETRAKLRTARLGSKHSPETKAKMSEARLGKKRPPEVGAKISATKREKGLSPESRVKMSDAKLGKKLSPETRAKISATKRAKKPSQQQAEQPPLF